MTDPWPSLPLDDGTSSLPGVHNSSVAWGDYDNDGDLAVLLSGRTDDAEASVSRIYRTVGIPNTAPEPPAGLSVTLDGTDATFGWDAATDSETPSAGLTYNLRIGTTPGSSDLLSPMANVANGYRRVPRLGNTNHQTSWAITLPEPLPPQIYWSVQAIDAAFAGSAFAVEDSIVIVPVDVPDRGDVRPSAFMLHSSAPNPMMTSTTIAFDLPRAAPVAVRIYDVRGRLVRTLVDAKEYPAGRHVVTWDGRGRQVLLSSGVYWVEMASPGYRSVHQLVLTR
jgi:hypothetical protein